MKLSSPQKEIYSKDRITAAEAQRKAQEIAFAPVVFQVSRLMVKFGIFDLLRNNPLGLKMEEIIRKIGLSPYATQVLLESSLTAGTILLKDELFTLSKTGWFLLTDQMARVNLDFNHDVNYLGLFNLEEALINSKPEGLKVFGEWPTIYEGLSSLPRQVQQSWFAFDHFYSDNSFRQALNIVFNKPVKKLLDVGGNTGRFAMQCVTYNKDVEVTIMDLPQQLELMREQTSKYTEAERIQGYPANLLDPKAPFPSGFDAIWMSQFLDCFSEKEVRSILTRAAASMGKESRLYIMETLWDRQKHETASYCLTQTSVYFTAMANGNSKMFYSSDLIRLAGEAGLTLETIHDRLGLGHSILVCRKIDLEELIPQRNPIIMVDHFYRLEDKVSYTGLTIREDNLFFKDGKLDECGVTEHIAQSAAARIGYICEIRDIPVPIGYIGSVDKMTFHRLPVAGEILQTRIEVIQEVFDITLISAIVTIGDEIIAEGQMKIFINNEK